MLSKPHRLRKQKEFNRVYRARNSRGDGVFVIYTAPNQRAVNRFGIVIGKKYGHAVARNRAKRQVREILRHNLPQLQPGWDVIIQVKRDLGQYSFWTIEQRLLTLLGRFGLLGESGHVRGMVKAAIETT